MTKMFITRKTRIHYMQRIKKQFAKNRLNELIKCLKTESKKTRKKPNDTSRFIQQIAITNDGEEASKKIYV